MLKLKSCLYKNVSEIKESETQCTSSTLAAVFAEVSMNMRPCSRANASPSSFFTSLRASKSLEQVGRINTHFFCIIHRETDVNKTVNINLKIIFFSKCNY